jgi:phosphomethylpyrimidine synthase
VDYFTIHAGVLLRYVPTDCQAHDRHRVARRFDHGQMVSWRTIKENFLYTHFEDICDIMKAYDVSRSRSATACAPARVADANDDAQLRRTENPWAN